MRRDPEPFQQLNRVIHEKGRLAIMSMLAASPELSFTELRDALAMTDGNLTRTSVHCRRLVMCPWPILSKQPPAHDLLADIAGRKAFAEYINLLEQIVRQNKPR